MNIIQTINEGFNRDKIFSLLKQAKSNDIYGIRFNLCRYPEEEQSSAIDFLGNIMCDFSENFQFSLDIPFPNNKVRIKQYNIKNSKLHTNTIYRIIAKEIKDGFLKENDILVDIPYFSEKIINEKIIYYGDGSGAFLIKNYERDILIVQALNNFEIWVGKSLTCGLVQGHVDIINHLSRLSKLGLEKQIVFYLSFVENIDQIRLFKENLSDLDKYLIIPKIESVNDFSQFESIIAETDGAMLARGDMALYMPMFKMLDICRCISSIISTYEHSKRLFVATDVLMSLQNNYIPLRSEIIDLCLMKELQCTDVVIPNYYSNIPRFIKCIQMLESS